MHPLPRFSHSRPCFAASTTTTIYQLRLAWEPILRNHYTYKYHSAQSASEVQPLTISLIHCPVRCPDFKASPTVLALAHSASEFSRHPQSDSALGVWALDLERDGPVRACRFSSFRESTWRRLCVRKLQPNTRISVVAEWIEVVTARTIIV